MRSLEELLEEYSKSHQNSINIAIHKIMVPLIMWSILGLMYNVPIGPYSFLNLSLCFTVGCLIYYFYLSLRSGLSMCLLSVIMLFSLYVMDHFYSLPVLKISLLVFLLAWIFQFVGHKIEGKKPSFLEDILFLLIGPLWTISFLQPKKKIKNS